MKWICCKPKHILRQDMRRLTKWGSFIIPTMPYGLRLEGLIFLKKAGTSYSGIEAKGVLLPLYELNCRFKAPAKYEDEIVVMTSIKQCSCVRLRFSYQICDASNNKLIATGETMHAWTDKAFRPVDAHKTVPDVLSILSKLLYKNKGV